MTAKRSLSLNNIRTNIFRSNKLSLGQQQDLFHELSSLIQAGISLGEALSLMEMSDGPLQTVVQRWKKGVESGKSLAKLSNASPECDNLVISKMIQVGETTGSLGKSLKQLSDYFESLSQLRKQVISALLYPCVVFFVTVVAVIILTVYVIPMFMEMFQRYKVELPLITKILIGGSRFFREYGLILLGCSIVLIFFLKTSRYFSKQILFSIIYKVPFLGTFTHNFMHLTMLQALSNLLESDIRVHEALALLVGIYPDPKKNNLISEISERVLKGDSFSRALKQNGLFPPKEIRIIQVGEETGKLAIQMGYLAEIYKKRINYALASFLALFEPLMIVGLSLIIGIVLVGLYLPLFDILSGSALTR